MQKTVLLTGATGFLGSHLVQKLAQDGYRLILLKRRSSSLNHLDSVLKGLASGTQISAYNIDDCALEKPFLECGPIDAVIHVATNYGAGETPASEVLASNTLFPLQLLELAVRAGVPLFFNTDSYFNTGCKPYEYKYLPAYSLSKKHFVDWGRQIAEAGDTRFVNLKLQHVFGPGDGEQKFTTRVFRSCLRDEGELDLTPGTQERDFIYVDDVVSAYSFLLERAREQSAYQHFDLGLGKSLSVRAFVETVHRVTQSKTELRFGALPLRDHEIMHAQADISPLLALGWRPAFDVESGVRQTVDWYRNENRAPR